VGQSLDKTNCHLMNAYYMARKYRLFDCKTEISISLNAQLNIERRRHGVMLTLRRQ